MSKLEQTKNILLSHWSFFVFGFLFFVLLFRAPFSDRTLIPNFEPYPDSFHYILPARQFLQGKGLTMDRIGKILPGVPPLYSLFIIPFFVIFNDPRMVYFANLTLSLLSLIFFYLIVQKIFSSRLVRLLVLILFVTHPILVWYVELVMAEHVTLALTLLGLWLVLRNKRQQRSFFAGVLAPLFYAAKYAAAPISFTFGLIFGLRHLWEAFRNKSYKPLLLFVLGLLVSGGIYLAITHSIRGTSELNSILSVLGSKADPSPADSKASSAPTQDPFFGTRYITRNLTAYTQFLLGEPMTILWKQEQILPMPFAILGAIGILISPTQKQKWFGATLLVLVISTFGFLSIFYVVDARYVYHLIPASILGVGITLQAIRSRLHNPKTILIFVLFMLVFLGAYTVLNAKRLKFRASLNLRYAETPWYYLATKEVDMYLKANGPYEKTPVVISPMPPFLFDFYTTEPKVMLPLHRYQEFRNATTQTWGDFDYTNLQNVFEKFLRDGHPVFVSAYGVGNEANLKNELELVVGKYSGQLVREGCHGLCNLYKLQLVKEERYANK